RTWTSRERAGRAEKKTRRSRDRTVSKGKGRRAPSYRALSSISRAPVAFSRK
ncbi:hypothetical protein M885DRAFT_538706, partial [Pelagophyceae sp. CCMP2097]